MFSRINTRNLTILALVSAAIFSLSACENSDDVASPVVDDTQIQAASLWLPTAELMVASTRANEGQEAGLRKARGSWESADFESGTHPMHGFLTEASKFLSDEQMVSLVNLIAETREEHRGQNGQRADGRRGMRGQRQGRGQHGPRDGILEHATDLALSEEQIAQLTALREQHQAQARELMGERQRGQRGQRPTEEQRAQMDELRDTHQAQVKEILTEEQWTKLEELRTAKREERREQRQERGMERQEQRIEFLAELLELADEQRTAVEAVMEEQHDKFQALSEEFRSGLEGERPTDGAREAHHEAMEGIRTETNAAIVELLDEDQAELFEALGKLRPEHRGRRGGRGRGR